MHIRKRLQRQIEASVRHELRVRNQVARVVRDERRSRIVHTSKLVQSPSFGHSKVRPVSCQ